MGTSKYRHPELVSESYDFIWKMFDGGPVRRNLGEDRWKMSRLLFFLFISLIFLSPFEGDGGSFLFAQNSQVNWSSFSSGFGLSNSTSSFTKSLAGQSFAGTSINGNTKIISGFLAYTSSIVTNINYVWIQQSSGTTNYLTDVNFTDTSTGTAVGYSGTIIRTTDGGTTWFSQTSGSTSTLQGVFFTDSNNGIAAGWGPVVLRTTDGGTNWDQISGIPGLLLYGVSFANADEGWIVGYSGTVLKTTDGGANWNLQQSGVSGLSGVSVSDENNVTAVGRSPSTIIRTTNGGITWISQSSGTNSGLLSVSFTDSSHGTVVGENGTILRTTDAGENWISQVSGTTNQLYGVSFFDSNYGIAVGASGTILRTTNGGTEWISEPFPTGEAFYGVSFKNPNIGTIVGSNGIIVRRTVGSITSLEENIAPPPVDFILSQNYPNPFNPNTTIKYEIPKDGIVTLKIYDVLGTEVTTLVNEEKSVGRYEVNFNAGSIASGVYFYRIQVDHFVDVKKMILLK